MKWTTSHKGLLLAPKFGIEGIDLGEVRRVGLPRHIDVAIAVHRDIGTAIQFPASSQIGGEADLARGRELGHKGILLASKFGIEGIDLGEVRRMRRPYYININIISTVYGDALAPVDVAAPE